MFKRYVSIIASVLLAVTFLLPATSSIALANTDVQQSEVSTQATNYTVDVEVEGLSGVILKEPIEITAGQNALDALKKALTKNEVPSVIKDSTYGPYIESINNEAGASLGGWDGWKYSVNGVDPDFGIAEYTLEENDKLRVFYARWAAISTSSTIVEGSKNPILTVNLVGDRFTPEAMNAKNWSIQQSDLTISEITQKNDQQIKIQLNGTVQRNNFSLAAAKAVVVGKTAETLNITVAADKGPVPNAIKKVTDYIVSKPVSSEWTAVGLARAGVTVPASYEEAFNTNLQQQIVDSIERLKITDAERLTIAAVAIGKDPENINGINLLDYIYNSIDIREVDTMTRQGTNGLIFALIALDTQNYEVPKGARWNREKIIAELLKYQLESGAWSLATSSTGSPSYDMTAMALISLAPYTNQPEVIKAVDRAANFLSKQQGPTGGFNEAFVGGISSEATSQIIIGLTANNIDPQDEAFTKNGINLIDHLLSFQTEEGGFKHTSTGKVDGMATEQAIQALVAYDLFTKNEGALYDFTNLSTQSTPKVTEVNKLTSLINLSLLKVQKDINGKQSSIFIEKTEFVDGYFIVQAGETSGNAFTTIPRGAKEVFVVNNDRPYKHFDAKVVEPTHEFTVTFNKEIKNSKENLNKIYVEDIAGNRVPVTVTANGLKATVKPDTNYASGQLYSLVVNGPISIEEKELKQSARKLFIIK